MRKLLIISVLLLFGANVFAMKYKEAPMLAEMVKNGDIPSIDKRLPKHPLLLKKE